MKNIYLFISALLLCNLLWAQQPQGRTAVTIVADVLIQMPAQNQTEFNQLFKALSSTGEEGVILLVKKINASGNGSNAQVEYALNGLSQYVVVPGRDALRSTIANAYCKALEVVSDREAKAFIVRQLQLVGKDESVSALSALMNQESLVDPAVRALASIHTAKSFKALMEGLKNTNSNIQRDIILALTQVQDATMEDTFLSLLKSTDENIRKEVLSVLSKNGTVKSLPVLAGLAEKAGFTLEKTGANEAYIVLIKRIMFQGNVKEAEEAANELLSKATKAGKVQTRDAAMEILLSIKKADGLKLVLIALKDTSRTYRSSALRNVSGYVDDKFYVALIKAMDKAKADPKVDVLYWLASQCQYNGQRENICKLKIKGNKSAIQVIGKQIKDDVFEVKEAATWTLVKLGDAHGLTDLVDLLKSSDSQVVTLAQLALASFNGDIASSVVKVMEKASDIGKVAGLKLLALRKSSANQNTVLALTKSVNPEIKKAAYSALKDVVEEKDFNSLCDMIEGADAATVNALQAAVTSSVSGMAKEAKVKAITSRLNQAADERKHYYYVVLARTGDPKVLPVITDGFFKGTGVAKDAAFDALLSWSGTETANDLYLICKDAASTAYFDRALNAYIKLFSNPLLTGENRLIGLRKAMEIAKTDTQKNAILRQIERCGTYLALLYAGDFLDEKPLQQNAANAVMNIALGNKSYSGDNVRALLNKVMGVLDNPDAGYQKEAIRKLLDEMPAGKGFVTLFNGKDLSGWKGLVQNPIARSKMKPEDLAKAQEKADEVARNGWSVVDGKLMFNGKGDNLCTEKQYGDFEMYVDWLLDPAGPEADAGIYLRGSPQVQIWDLARINVGAQVGSGGLYNNQVNLSKPLKVADNKLGEWNSFYIKMMGDRVTVYLNGVLVVDNVILENYWDRKLPVFPIEQIELQAHGSKVYYRNIYIRELERPDPFKLSADEVKEGYKVLFDGTNMHQWTGNTVEYSTKDGCISLTPGKSFGGNLYTKDEFKDFDYRFEFQLTPGANNGLGIRTPMEGDAAYVGMELQILDNEDPVYKDLHSYQYHGSVYGIIPAKRGFLKPVGEWNYQEVIAKGDHIKIILNGTVILDGDIREATKNGTPDGNKHPGLFNEKGHIGFLGHGSPVKFRNIRIKEL